MASYEVVSAPLNGSVAIVDGVATFTPTADYTGKDSFTYKAVDDDGEESNVSTVVVTILASVSILDVVESNTDNIKIYPNPASDFVTVESSVDGEIVIMNLQEQIVRRVTSDKTDISDLRKGIYYGVILKDGKVKAAKSFYKDSSK